jgi:hypothetical protein
LACGAAIDAMPPASIRDTIRVRNMGCFLVTPYKNVCIGRFVPPQRAHRLVGAGASPIRSSLITA